MKYLFFLSFLICTICNADLFQRFKRENFEGHSYIIYDGIKETSIVHDPDCGCDREWRSVTRDIKGEVIGITHYILKPFDQQG